MIKPNIIRGKIHNEDAVWIKIRKGISKQAKSMNKVIEAIINGNNMQKMKVSSQPKGNMCACVVCVCFECPISVVLEICITDRFNLGQTQYFI
jgi:hypothetical protein